MHYKKREWTVFFLIRADGTDITHIIQMINDIRSIPTAENPAIIFCVKMLQENRRALEEGDTSLMTQSTVKTATTLFYQLTPETQITTLANRLTYIDENADFDLSDPVCLEDYFREVILKPFKARHYLLVTFDHGNAFGIFPGTVVNNPDKLKALSMEELNLAIRFALQCKKVDVVIMVNCFMQSAMAGFALHRSVKYLVAPESDMHFSGYNYASIFHLIANRKNLKGRALAKHAVASFPAKAYSEFQAGVGRKNGTAVFAARCKHYHLLPRLIDQLVDVLTKLNPFPYDDIMHLQDTLSFGTTDDLVDLYLFITKLMEKNIFSDRTFVPATLFALQDMIIQEQFIGKDLCPPDRPDKHQYLGLSIFFPAFIPPRDEWETFPRFKQFLDSDLGRNTQWEAFLVKLFNEKQLKEKTDLVAKQPNQFQNPGVNISV